MHWHTNAVPWSPQLCTKLENNKASGSPRLFIKFSPEQCNIQCSKLLLSQHKEYLRLVQLVSSRSTFERYLQSLFKKILTSFWLSPAASPASLLKGRKSVGLLQDMHILVMHTNINIKFCITRNLHSQIFCSTRLMMPRASASHQIRALQVNKCDT